MKLSWIEGGDKIWTRNGTLNYKVRRIPYKGYSAVAGLSWIGTYPSQLLAIKACQAYEDKLTIYRALNGQTKNLQE
jgi:hypothetical protein